MTESIISVQNISKRYTISHVNEQTDSFREALTRKFKNMVRRGPSLSNNISKEEFWALSDISFDIQAGERVGIIGRNGAGKSTLLKILSRIVEPTRGTIDIRGRVASLLEVGTGFHPELSGRENVFLNGAILGMSRHEIKAKFDEIVAFAEVEKFIDTPVKRYSSGMYVRLAFAVAAHLEPEILVVDEVLAVGDAQFQKKCLGKMEDVSKGQGRTVLFVSHNMQAVNTLCTHGIFMHKGHANPKVAAREAVNQYTSFIDNSSSIQFPIVRKDLIIHAFNLRQDNQVLVEYDGGRQIDVTIEFETFENLSNFRIGFFLKNLYGELLNRSLLADWDAGYSNLKKGRYLIKGSIPANLLAAGTYNAQVHSSRYGLVDYCTDEPTTINFTVLPPEDYNQAYIGERVFGTVMIKQKWEVLSV